MANVSHRNVQSTRIHIMALDGIVNVNSLFTFALFLGIAFTDPKTKTLIGNDTRCSTTAVVSENLIVFHVCSFSSFLFSSLIALSLKEAIKIGSCGMLRPQFAAATVNTVVLRIGILATAIGSVSGCGFLTMALVDLVQIKLGSLACRSLFSVAAIAPLVILVPSALVIYVCLVIYAFIH